MKTYQAPPIDVAEKSVFILKTVLLLDRAYSSNYIVRILTADETFAVRNESHKNLETYGALAEESFNRLGNVVNYLVKTEFLRIADLLYGTVEITDAGTAYLSAPKPLIAARRQLSPTWYEMQAIMGLRQIRKELAVEMDMVPYELYNNFAIQCLVETLPQSIAEMSQIPALANLPEGCWEPVLAEMHRIAELKEKDAASGGMLTKAYSPSHRKLKGWFEEGLTISEMAQAGKWKEGTVQNYLINLHKADQINLLPWLEALIDPKDLHRGADYFRQAADARLTTAKESLNLDYDTLRWCRFYSGIAVRQAA